MHTGHRISRGGTRPHDRLGRKHKHVDEPAPDGWPKDIRPISLEGLTLFGIGRDGQIYWDGQKLVTEKRLATYERVLATMGAAAAVTVAVVEVGRSIGWWQG
ncbi:hypothetical protein MesoLjLb_49610 [Mesorhizobium sp. L-8-3]|nr:hypothetical protein MesoLjLb_49610 [Mesorhizobium sp. L-8-3]